MSPSEREQHHFLVAYDHEKDYHPDDFDYKTALARLAELKAGIDQTFGDACEEVNTRYIQDTCHYGELVVPAKISTTEWRPCVHLCNFGGMVAISNEASLVPGALDKLTHLFERLNFHYISEELLHGPYTGVHTSISTWWVRYFDYL